jgi:hypothetical protein
MPGRAADGAAGTNSPDVMSSPKLERQLQRPAKCRILNFEVLRTGFVPIRHGCPRKEDRMSHWLFLPDDAFGDLAILADLPASRLNTLRGYLDSHEFRQKYSFFIQVAELLDISDESAAKLCTFVHHVQSQRAKAGKTGADVPSELESFLERAGKDAKYAGEKERLLTYVRDHRGDLAELFSDLPVRDFSVKLRGLETGPLPHLHSFRMYCDLRPVFDKAADEIVSCFPVITLSLITHSTESDKTEETLVQLAESDLSELRDQLKRLDKKLSQIKKQPLMASDANRKGDGHGK